jgi:hypothetical protein
MVSCLRSRLGLTSWVTLPPSSTKHTTPPSPSAAYRGQPSLRHAGCVERHFDAQAVCERLDRGDGVVGLRVSQKMMCSDPVQCRCKIT